MVTKNDSFDTGDFNPDSSLDFDSMDFGFEDPADDRHPVLRLGSKTGESLLSKFTDTGVISKLVKKSIPREFHSTYDAISDAVTSMKEVYREAADELKPAANEMRKVAYKFIPEAEEILPKSTYQRLREALKPEEEYNYKAPSEEELQSEATGRMLSELFTTQLDSSVQLEKSRASREIKLNNLNQQFEESRHRQQLTYLQQMTSSLRSMSKYQTTITNQYHRKSLELNLRQLMTQQSLLAELRYLRQEQSAIQKGILKNTGLPEIVKASTPEMIKDLMKNKFLASMDEGIFGQRRNFAYNLGQDIRKRVVGKAKDIASNMSTLSGMGDMMSDMGGSVPGMYMGMAGDYIADFIIDQLTPEAAKKVREKLNSIKDVKKKGEYLQYLVANQAQIAKKWAGKFSRYDEVFEDKANEYMTSKGQTGMLGKFVSAVAGMAGSGTNVLADFLKGSVNNTLDSRRKIESIRGNDLLKPDQWNQRSTKTLNEIIPGYLARILRELQITRTGDEKTDLTTFDLMKGKWSTRNEIRKSIRSGLVSDSAKTSHRYDEDRLMNLLDPNQTLTKRHRDELSRALLDANLQTQEGNLENMSKLAGGRYKRLFRNYFGDGQDYAKNKQFTDLYNNFGDVTNGIATNIQTYSNLGYGDLLDEEGFVDDRNLVNDRKIHKLLYDRRGLPTSPMDIGQYVGSSTKEAAEAKKKRSRQPTATPTGDFTATPESGMQTPQSKMAEELKPNLDQVNAGLKQMGQQIYQSVPAPVKNQLQQIREAATKEWQLQIAKPEVQQFVDRIKSSVPTSVEELKTTAKQHGIPLTMDEARAVYQNTVESVKASAALAVTIAKDPNALNQLVVQNPKLAAVITTVRGVNDQISIKKDQITTQGALAVLKADAKLMTAKIHTSLPESVQERITTASQAVAKQIEVAKSQLPMIPPVQSVADVANQKISKALAVVKPASTVDATPTVGTVPALPNPLTPAEKPLAVTSATAATPIETTPADTAMSTIQKASSAALALGASGIATAKKRLLTLTTELATKHPDVAIQITAVTRALEANAIKPADALKVATNLKKQIVGALPAPALSIAQRMQQAVVKTANRLGAAGSLADGLAVPTVAPRLSVTPDSPASSLTATPALPSGLVAPTPAMVASMRLNASAPNTSYGQSGWQNYLNPANTPWAGLPQSAVPTEQPKSLLDAEAPAVGDVGSNVEKILLELVHINTKLELLPAFLGHEKQTLFGKAGGMIRKGFSSGLGFMNKAAQAVGSVQIGAAKFAAGLMGRAAMPLGKMTLGVVGKTIGSVRDMLGKYKDVYLPGDIKPRILAEKMKRGLYFDSATGKTIPTFKDLRKVQGNVVDENGEVKLTQEDLGKAQVNENGYKPLTTVLGGLASASKWMGSGMLSVIPPAVRTAMSITKGIFNVSKVIATAARQVDVYVKGEGGTPALYAVIMKNGGYYRKSDGQPMKSLKDLNGPVLDAEGNVVLRPEQIEKGLVDVHGKPLRVGGTILGSVVHKGLSLMGKMAGLGVDMIRNPINAMKGFIGALFSERFPLFAKMSTTNNWLEKIYNLIDARMPASKRKLSGDTDGDGIRDGSIEDLERKGKLRGSKDGQGVNAAERVSSNGKSLLETLNPMNKIKSMLGLGADAAATAAGVAGAAGKGSLAARALGGTMNLVKGAGRLALGGAGTLARGAMALTPAVLPSLASAATSASTFLIGGGLTSALGAGAAAIGSVLSAPVVLGGAALALAGYGAYKGYQKFKNRMKDLNRLRYAQYGFNPESNDYGAKIFAFEDMLQDALIKTTQGPEIDESKIDKEKLMGTLDVDPKDPKALQAWANWYASRFKPVFLRAVAAMQSVDPKAKLADADDLAADKQMQFLKAAWDPSGSYDYMGSPFIDLPQLDMNRDAVTNVYQNVMAKIKDQIGDDGKPKPGMIKRGLAAMGVAVSSLWSGDKSKPEDTVKTGALTKLGTVAAVAAVGPAGAALTAAVGIGSKISMTSDSQVEPAETDVSALRAVRYKTYGLGGMDPDKTSALRSLEYYLEDKITFDGQRQASFSGSLDQVAESTAAMFSAGPEAFKDWFQRRFLPAYLNFRSALYKCSKKTTLAEEGRLSPNNQLTVALAVRGSAVWTVTTSPWDGYSLTTDVKDTEGNLNAIKQKVKELPSEEGKQSDAKKSSEKSDATKEAEARSDAAKGLGIGSVLGSITSTASGLWDRVKAGASVVSNAVGKTVDAVKTGVNTAQYQYSQGASLGQAVAGGVTQATEKPTPKYTGKMDTFPTYKAVVAELMKRKWSKPAIAAVLGSLAAESGFQPQSENMNYKSVAALRKIFTRKTAGKSDAELSQYIQNPQAAGDYFYSHLGGWKYRGRGLVQLTGIDNYRKFSRKIFGDDRMVDNPDLANEPDTAAKIAVEYMEQGAIPLAQKKFGKPLMEMNVQEATRAVTNATIGPAVNLDSTEFLREAVAKRTGFAMSFLEKLDGAQPATPAAATGATPSAATPPKPDGSAGAPSTSGQAPVPGPAAAPGATAATPAKPVTGTAAVASAAPSAPGTTMPAAPASAVTKATAPATTPVATPAAPSLNLNAPKSDARNQASALQEQATFKSDEMVKSLGSLSQIAVKQTEISAESLSVLKKMLEVMSKPSVMTSTPSTPASEPTPPQQSVQRQAKPMSAAPIQMDHRY